MENSFSQGLFQLASFQDWEKIMKQTPRLVGTVAFLG
jgi:hypothetical protein